MLEILKISDFWNFFPNYPTLPTKKTEENGGWEVGIWFCFISFRNTFFRGLSKDSDEVVI